jgi:hypothetical protein
MGKNIFMNEYDPGEIKDFEKRVLAENLCKSFLPSCPIR